MIGEITWGTAAAVLAAPFAFILPGLALLALLGGRRGGQPEERLDGASWLILAAGLTLALVPILLLAARLLGQRLGPASVLVLLLLSAAAAAWRLGRHWPARWRQLRARPWLWSRIDGVSLILTILTLLVVGVRLWVVRGINTPFFGDGLQHTVIAQLVLDNGGLFDSWEPYDRLRSLTYHFGFHGVVAFFQWATSWLTGIGTPRAVVLVGQFVNALAALSLYPLAVRLAAGRRWAGVVAVLLAGLVLDMPMFYVNWGRYTQLAAQAILPVALWLTIDAVEAPRWDAGRTALAALAVAGLGLTHYRVALFYPTFLLPYLAFRLLVGRRRPRQVLAEGRAVAGIGLLAGVLVLPWLLHVGQGYLVANAQAYQQGGGSEELRAAHNALLPNLHLAPGGWLVVAAVGGLWAMARRHAAGVVVVWGLLNVAVANSYLVGVLDTGFVNNFTVLISLYLPAALLVGWLAAELAQGWPGRGRAVAALLLAVVVLAGGLAGTAQQADVLDRTFQIVTPADEQAMAWIRQETPEDARFLINSFVAYGGLYVVGSDAGWWLPLLAGRQNTVPTLYYSGEAAEQPDYREQVLAFARRVEQSPLDDPATVRFLRGEGISHVYVGQVGGSLLDPVVLQNSPFYELIYQVEQVYVFALRRE